MKLKNRGIVMGLSCLRCGKTLRNDYQGLCMDCVDILGLSEFLPEKSVKEIKEIISNDMKEFKWHIFELFPRAKIDIVFVIMGLIKPQKKHIWQDKIYCHYKMRDEKYNK